MKVRLLVGLAGADYSYRAGDVADLPEGDALRLLATGLAEDPPAPKPSARKRQPRTETATAPAVETPED